MPDDRHGHVYSGNAVSSFLSSVVSWSRGHSCHAERNFSALANVIGDLRSNMRGSKVERMLFIRLKKHMVD